MKKLGYAVLGLGIGMAHVDAAVASEYADLVAVCDIDEARLKKCADLHPEVKLYREFDELIRDKDVDIISICLPSAMHADFAVRAMEAGKHVLVEKPLDITYERAMLIEEARKRTGVTVGVVHQNRFNLNMYPSRVPSTRADWASWCLVPLLSSGIASSPTTIAAVGAEPGKWTAADR